MATAKQLCPCRKHNMPHKLTQCPEELMKSLGHVLVKILDIKLKKKKEALTQPYMFRDKNRVIGQFYC